MTRRMSQPRKDVLREQLALAADEIIRLRTVNGEIHRMYQSAPNPTPAPWWRRLLAWVGA